MFRKCLFSILILSIALAIIVLVTTHDASLKASIWLALFPEALIFKLKALAVFLPLFLLFVYLRHLAPDLTKWIQTAGSFASELVRQKMNTRQTVIAIISVAIFFAISIPLGPKIGKLLGWLLSAAWFACLLIPLHFLRSSNQPGSNT